MNKFHKRVWYGYMMPVSLDLCLLEINIGYLDELHKINSKINSECDKLQPATGFFQCDTKNMASESSCHFKCPLGLLPGGDRKTSCKKMTWVRILWNSSKYQFAIV